MAKVAAFHSINETKKPAGERAYHNNDACPRGGAVPKHERRDGNGGDELCAECVRRHMGDQISDKAREDAPILERRR